MLLDGFLNSADGMAARLQGWRSQNLEGHDPVLEPFGLEPPMSSVKLLATVVYVKRRP